MVIEGSKQASEGTVRQYSHFVVVEEGIGDTVPGHHTERYANRPGESERGTAEITFQRFREARPEA